ncbi:ABC transporter ATP-binding protein [Devosia ginsengisoli]|uniref:ABC transporter ATP-binding protein n=1 Tax=Devosia ginsengisoli TaxID=400770 RepID=A0A5B8LX96_9HYPH|nr:ABC transporter ATP-binding protein [Devosia ginsengisoli]QDZ12713.1 ABC transporter ATP-binding protein [Devosia ginsengisoli]
MVLLSIENLVVEFPASTGWFRAVDGVSMSVNEGEILAIVGESGSGKSVSMLAVMGLLPPAARVSADRLEFDGKDLRSLSARERSKIIGREISMIFQEPIASLNPSFTVGYQIDEVLKAHTSLLGRERRERVLELLADVGIPDPAVKRDSYPHQLSGGQCQRVMIAMAVACKPKLLLADEPTTALDVTIQRQILDLLMQLRRETGLGLVLITHNLGVVAATADRVVVQYDGRKMEEGDVVSIFESPRHEYTRALLAALPERAMGGRLPSVADGLAMEQAQ